MLHIKSFTFNPVEENTYLLYNENKECCIIDPGCYTAAERQVLQDHITEKRLKPVLLLNTHCHFDHVFGNKFIYDTYGSELYIHEKEKVLLDYAPESARGYGLFFDNYEGHVHFLAEHTIVRIGQDELKVLFIPGHAPGHIVFYCEKQGFVIGGDVLFRGSIGRTDLPFGDFDQLVTGIRSKLLTLPEETVVYPGHGGATTIGDEKRNNPFLT
ncbi:MAG TPA: MBL fold metallo-hydrolase [Chitinophagaceae bacterium]|nr:MBL fold metallo-hydrolase [Chitinophagaceae bacterium]